MIRNRSPAFAAVHPAHTTTNALSGAAASSTTLSLSNSQTPFTATYATPSPTATSVDPHGVSFDTANVITIPNPIAIRFAIHDGASVQKLCVITALNTAP